MNTWHIPYAFSSQHVLAWGLDVAIKATLLCTLLLAVALLLGRRRVLWCSSLANALLIGLLLLPAAAALFPRVALDLPAGHVTYWPPLPSDPPLAAAAPHGDDAIRRAPDEASQEKPSIAPARGLDEPTSQPGASGKAAAFDRPKPDAASPALRPAIDLPELAIAVYGVGVSFLLIRLVVGLGAVARLRRSCQPIGDAGWLRRLDYWRKRLGMRQAVALACHDRMRVPLVVGYRRATIVLPADCARSADSSQRDAVLLHELAHVHRADYAWQLVLRAVQAVYWFHPLCWALGPLIRRLIERACDDLCVHWLGDGAGYRNTLIDLARAVASRPSAVSGVAMVRSTKLGRRLKYIDGSRGAARCASPPALRVCVTAGILIATGLLGAVEPAREAAVADSPVALTETASPKLLQELSRSQIPAFELARAGGGDPAKAPSQLVAVVGCSRLNPWAAVKDVAFSPDGTRLATAGSDGTVRLWDPESAGQLRRLVAEAVPGGGHPAIESLAFSPDGNTLVAGGPNAGIVFWETATGRRVRVVQDVGMSVTSVAFHPQGEMIASGHSDFRVKLWDAASGKLLRVLEGHGADYPKDWDERAISSLAFSPDGRMLASASADRTVRLWDAASGELRRTLSGHEKPVRAVAFSPDGRLIASASWDTTVKLWDAAEGRLVRTIQAHDAYAQSLVFHPDGKTLITGGLDTNVKYWDVSTGKERLRFQASHGVGVMSLAVSPDGNTLASVGNSLRLWDARTGKERFAFPGHRGGVHSVAISPDDLLVASAGSDGTVRIWEIAGGTERHVLQGTPHWLVSVAFSPDGKALAALGFGRNVKLWETATGRLQRTLEAEGEIGRSIAFSPEGRWLAAGTLERLSSGRVNVWNAATGKLTHLFTTPADSLCFSPDGNKLITAGQKRQYRGPSTCVVTVWDLATGQPDETLEDLGSFSSLWAATSSADGNTLALAGSLYREGDARSVAVVLWDIPKRKPRLVLDHGPEGWIESLAFAPDGRTLLAVDGDATKVWVWDPRDGRLRETIAVPVAGRNHIRNAAFASDSRHFVAGMSNGTIYVFRVQAPPEEVEEATAPQPEQLAALTAAAPSTDLWKDLLGRPAPELQEIRAWLHGEPVKLAGLRGKHVLLYFWGLRSEEDLPALVTLHKLFGDRGLEIIVLYPDHAARAETVKSRLAAAVRRSGRQLPFRVALEGGGETPVSGTDLMTPGKTRAAYRVLYSSRGRILNPVALLVDRQGKLARSLPHQPHRGTHRELEELLGVKAKTPAWQAPLEQSYALPEGQVLRRVAPPFPPQRQDYVFHKLPGPPHEVTLRFRQNEKLIQDRVTTRVPLDLQSVLTFALQLKRYQFEGSDEVLGLEVPGDWVVRENASTEALLRALEGILRDELHQPVRFERREVQRDVIVVTGRYQYRHLPGTPDKPRIYLCVEGVPDPYMGRGGSGTLAKMWTWLGNRTGRWIVDESQAPADLEVRWQDRLARHVTQLIESTDEGAAKLKRVLANLSRQTSLEFRHERRAVSVWFVLGDE